MKKFLLPLAAAVTAFPALAFADGEVVRSASMTNQWSMYILLGLAMVFFYFIILRPERKRRKAMETRRNSMKKGDRVTTSTGIRATVHKIEGDTVIVKLYDGAKMEILKAAIADVQAVTAAETVVADEKKVELADPAS